MYAIRVEPQNHRLHVVLSGRVTTEEALRALSQSALLLDTDGLSEILCDITEIDRGPGRLLTIASSLALRMPATARMALITGPQQERITRRILRFSGAGNRARCFSDEDHAMGWLEERQVIAKPVTPEARHVEFARSSVSTAPLRRKTEQVGPAA